jgi:hypothetical protein
MGGVEIVEDGQKERVDNNNDNKQLSRPCAKGVITLGLLVSEQRKRTGPGGH